MVSWKKIVPVALGAATFVACNCFNLSANKLTLHTDCLGGDVSESTLDFAILPAVGDIDKELAKLPKELPLKCVLPEQTGFDCSSIGFGADPAGNAAMLCDVQMQVAGVVDPVANVFFLCVAEKAFGDAGIFPMKCTYVDIQQNPTSGPGGASGCQALAIIEETDSASSAAAGQAGG